MNLDRTQLETTDVCDMDKLNLLTDLLTSLISLIYCFHVVDLLRLQLGFQNTLDEGYFDTLPPKLDSQTLIRIYNPFEVQFSAVVLSFKRDRGIKKHSGNEKHINQS